MKKFWKWLSSLFISAAALIKKYITPSIAVVENFKLLIDSPVADMLTAVIPGGIDDAMKEQLRKMLPLVLMYLNISEETSKAKTTEEVLQAAAKALQLYSNDARNLTLHNISVLLAKYLSDGKLSMREAIHLTEEVYQQQFKKAA